MPPPTTPTATTPTATTPTATPLPGVAQADPGQVAGTIAKLRDVRDRLRDLKAEEEALTAALRAELGQGRFTPPAEVAEAYGLTGVAVTVSANRRFSTERAAQVLPPQYLPLVSKTVVDRELAEKVLTGELAPLLELCRVEGRDTVRIEVAK